MKVIIFLHPSPSGSNQHLSALLFVFPQCSQASLKFELTIFRRMILSPTVPTIIHIATELDLLLCTQGFLSSIEIYCITSEIWHDQNFPAIRHLQPSQESCSKLSPSLLLFFRCLHVVNWNDILKQLNFKEYLGSTSSCYNILPYTNCQQILIKCSPMMLSYNTPKPQPV